MKEIRIEYFAQLRDECGAPSETRGLALDELLSGNLHVADGASATIQRGSLGLGIVS
jgi:hypothetical protein